MRWHVPLFLMLLVMGSMLIGGERVALADSRVANPLVFVPGTFGCWLPDEYERLRQTFPMSVVGRIQEGLGVGEDKPYISFYDGCLGTAYLDPFGHAYDGLIAYLEGKGLKGEDDFWVFCYDTLSTSIRDNAVNLGHFIDFVRRATGAAKVDIMAHSQGGLIARRYIQAVDKSPEGSVGKLMMVGTPNMGCVTSYLGLEHAQFIQMSIPPMKDLGINIFLSAILGADTPREKRDRLLETKDGRRVYAPAFEMLPTFGYLRDKGGDDTEAHVPGQPTSPFLEELNSQGTERLGAVETHVVVTTGVKTISGVVITPLYKAGNELADKFDKVFDEYVNNLLDTDLHPAENLWDTLATPDLLTDDRGDGVVLLKSASLGHMLDENYHEIVMPKGPTHTEYFTVDGFPRTVKAMNGVMEGFLGL